MNKKIAITTGTIALVAVMTGIIGITLANLIVKKEDEQ